MPSDSSGLTPEVLFQVLPTQQGSVFDYEVRDKLEFQLKITGNDNKTDFKDFIVHIEDVNDNTPNFDSTSYEFDIKEDLSNLDPGDEIFIAQNIIASDLDRSDEFGTKSLRYSLSTRLDLNIDPINGSIWVQNGTNPFDYELSSQVKVTMIAKDWNGQAGCLSTDTEIIFNIQDVNDEPPTLKFATNQNVNYVLPRIF